LSEPLIVRRKTGGCVINKIIKGKDRQIRITDTWGGIAAADLATEKKAG